jgi:hypothetical protein
VLANGQKFPVEGTPKGVKIKRSALESLPEQLELVVILMVG